MPLLLPKGNHACAMTLTSRGAPVLAPPIDHPVSLVTIILCRLRSFGLAHLFFILSFDAVSMRPDHDTSPFRVFGVPMSSVAFLLPVPLGLPVNVLFLFPTLPFCVELSLVTDKIIKPVSRNSSEQN